MGRNFVAGRENRYPGFLVSRQAAPPWKDRVQKAGWIAFLAETKAIRSNTSVCLKITADWFTKLPDEEKAKAAKKITAMLDKEGVANDINSYGKAPAGIRIWCGATVETSDVAALEISPTTPLMSETRRAIRLNASPVAATNLPPLSTCEIEVEISALISLAACAERCASARTSEATTAKPRPASPARAASTPAFRASRLVWKAISSMTPMIWPMRDDDSVIADIASTALPTTSALCLASSSASLTTSRAR